MTPFTEALPYTMAIWYRIMLTTTPRKPENIKNFQSFRFRVTPFFFNALMAMGSSTRPPMRKRRKVIWMGWNRFPKNFRAVSMVPNRNAVTSTKIYPLFTTKDSFQTVPYFSPRIRTSGSSQTPLMAWTLVFTSSISCRISLAVAWPRFTTNPVCFSETWASPTR
jgi:hypothetical protein